MAEWIILLLRKSLAIATILVALVADVPSQVDRTTSLSTPTPTGAVADADGPRDPDGTPGDEADGEPGSSSGVGRGEEDEPVTPAPPAGDTIAVDQHDDVPADDQEDLATREAGGLDVNRSLDIATRTRDEHTLDFELQPDTSQAQSTSGLNATNDLKTGVGCEIWCFTKGVAYARGVDIELVIETDTPAFIDVYVYGAPNFDVDSGPGKTMFFSVDLTGLQPGADYQVIATATDSAGKTSYAFGSFTTLRRQAEVIFHGFEVDEYPYDERFDFHYRVDGIWPQHLSDTHWPFPTTPPSLPKPVVIEDAPAVLDGLMVQVKSFDACPNWVLCDYGGAVDLPSTQLLHGTGTIGELDHAWGTAYQCTGGVDLDDRPASATSWAEHELVVALTTQNGCANDQPVQFSVGVTIAVTYVE